MGFNNSISIPNVQGSAMIPSNSVAPVVVTNLATGGVIGTASATVDVNTVFEITQTTVGQTVTLPTPSVASGAKIYVVKSAISSTASFSLYGNTIAPNQALSILWNGSIYTAINEPVAIDSIQTTSSSITVSKWNSIVLVDATAAVTITLPTNSTGNIGKEVIIIKTLGTNNVTVALNGSTIVGTNNLTLASIGACNTYKSTTASQVVLINSRQTNIPNSPENTLTPITISNLATGGVIGTAAATVDINSYFLINQTTVGQTLTLPTPTNTTATRVANVRNTGTASFSLYTNTIQAGAEVTLGYNGTSWLVTGGAASSTKIDVPNIAANGNILTAATSVDIANTLAFTQTTVGITATLLNPTTTTTHKVITLENLPASTQSITITAVSGDTFSLGVSQSLEVWWNGTSWRLFNPAQVLSEYGENNGITDGATFTTAVVDITGSSFTLPSAGVWKINYVIFGENSGTGNANTIALYTSADVIVPNSLIRTSFGANADDVIGINGVIITTSGSATFKLKGQTTAGIFTVRNNAVMGSNNTGNSKIIYSKISGFSSVTGQSVDFKTVSGWNASAITAATDAVFTNIGAGNIPYSAGLFTLTAGKTYEITGHLEGTLTGNTGTDWQQFILCDAANTQLPNSPTGVITGISNSNQWQNTSTISTIFTPTATTQVKLRLNNRGSSVSFSTNASLQSGVGCWMTVTQLGTSATITTPKSILQLDNSGATAQAATAAAAGTGTGVLWGVSMFTKGSKISFTANNGTVTLAGGVNGTTYRLTGKANSTGSTSNAYIFYRFYNVTTVLQIGSEGYTVDPDNGVGGGTGWDETSSPVAYAYITVPSGTTQQIRLAVTSSSATPGNLRQQSGQTSCTIEEIEG